jgi:hypothetical protein
MNRVGENFSVRFFEITASKSPASQTFPEYTERNEDRQFESPLLQRRVTANHRSPFRDRAAVGSTC